MNASFAVVLVLAVWFGVWAFRARALDLADEFHLIHGPADGCLECEDK